MPVMERLIRATHKLLALAICLTLCATVLSYLGGIHWRFDYLAHGRVQWCALSAVLLAAGLATVAKESIAKRYIVLATGAFGRNAYPIAAFSFAPPPTVKQANGPPTLRVMAVKVNIGNRQYDAVIHDIERENPDLLLIMEVNRSWMRHLAKIERAYPYKIAAPRQHAFGMVLYSKTPFVGQRIEEWGAYRLPYIVATTRDNDGNLLRILGVHTVPPVGETAAFSNHRQSRHIFDSMSDREGPIIMLGDWNDTPWSYSYRTLLSGSNFKNAAQGRLPAPTWRTGFLGGIMIDHIFVKKMRVGGWHTGQKIASDHRAVIADLQVIPKRNNIVGLQRR